MFELMKKKMTTLKALAAATMNILLCHRAIYGGLALCHALGCLMTGEPELYGPMALLYAILALTG